MVKRGLSQFIFAVLMVLYLVSSSLVGLATEYFWFGALGFDDVFWVGVCGRILLFIAAALVFALFAGVNLWLSSKIQGGKKDPVVSKVKLGLLIVLAFIVGGTSSSSWFDVLQYMHQVPFNLADPIFGLDVSFYVFTLPFYLLVWNFLILTLIFTAILVGIDYLRSFLTKLFTVDQTSKIEVDGIPQVQISFGKILDELKRNASIHLAVLASLIFVLLAWRHYLSRYMIMFSESGIVVGAGFTDVNVFLPVVTLLAVLALVVAGLFYFWMFTSRGSDGRRRAKKVKKRYFLLYGVAIYLIVVFVGGSVIPGVVQSLRVSPNELALERPFIERNIEFTRYAYDLNDVKQTDFPVNLNITAESLAGASETIDNVRILDWRPLTKTYKQTQEIRLYYDLSGVDIDRYNIDGKYTQVMLAPREMDQNSIAENAKTWVNLHMIYTHGYGVVMSPVNSVTKQGLPDYYIQDIPPIYNVDEPSLTVERPEVYYGEKENDYVLVNTNTNEFDYPKGNENQYTNYAGLGGITLDSFGKKFLLAWRMRDIKILLSTDLTSESKIMYDRSIQRRISKIMPFLDLDKDPYMVIVNGRLKWVQDAYTSSSNFPYSEKIYGINYIRNSVKAVVDAYDGNVEFYIADERDPIIKTYANIFPSAFKSMATMPEELKSHMRYPEDLFKVQSYIYSVYHMDNPEVFYNKEDAWDIPYEVYGTGQQVRVEPYYVIMELPGEDKEEFVLMTTFTPIKKDNMIAWFAARSDGEHYGKLKLYQFPKDKLVYGPLQIEARIDQDSEISQQLTLWSQQGSQVTRGNLLVIPIDDSLLYVEPLYIQADTGQLPELKRIIVSDGERVVMERTLAESLEALFGKASIPRRTTREGPGDDLSESGDVIFVDDDLATAANQYYANILDAMEEGDWTSFGENFEELGRILEQLEVE